MSDRNPTSGPCCECGAKVSIWNLNRSPMLSQLAGQDEKPAFASLLICKACANGNRPWRCGSCDEVFSGRATHMLTKGPVCPFCESKASRPVPTPAEVRGDAAKVAGWKAPSRKQLALAERGQQAEVEERARMERIAKLILGRDGKACEYLGGHPGAPEAMSADVFTTPAGVVVASGGFQPSNGRAFLLPWVEIADISHDTYRDGSDADRLRPMMLATRAGADSVSQWAGLLSTFTTGAHTVHLMVITSTSPDGFETKAAFKVADALTLVGILTSARSKFMAMREDAMPADVSATGPGEPPSNVRAESVPAQGARVEPPVAIHPAITTPDARSDVVAGLKPGGPPPAAQRKVSMLLALGIIFLPWAFSWFTLRRGHTTRARVISLGWAAMTVMVVFNGGHEDRGRSRPASAPREAPMAATPIPMTAPAPVEAPAPQVVVARPAAATPPASDLRIAVNLEQFRAAMPLLTRLPMTTKPLDGGIDYGWSNVSLTGQPNGFHAYDDHAAGKLDWILAHAVLDDNDAHNLEGLQLLTRLVEVAGAPKESSDEIVRWLTANFTKDSSRRFGSVMVSLTFLKAKGGGVLMATIDGRKGR